MLRGEIHTIPRLLSQITKPTPMLPIGNFLLYFGLFLADTINIRDKGLENAGEQEREFSISWKMSS